MGSAAEPLLKPLEAGHLSYYVIRLAGTPNESCGNLSALWIAPSTTTIYQLARHLIPPTPTRNTHIHNPVIAKLHPSLDGLEEIDWACNGIPMLNTPPSVFCHLGVSTLFSVRSPRGNHIGLFQGFFFPPSLITMALLRWSCLTTFILKLRIREVMLWLLLLPCAADRASFPIDDFAFDLAFSLPCGSA